MKKLFNLFFLIGLLFVYNVSLAEDNQIPEKYSFGAETQSYTETYSGSVITIPENWVIDEPNGEPQPNSSKMILFAPKDKSVCVSFTVKDLYESLPFLVKMTKSRNDINNEFVLKSQKANNPDSSIININEKEYVRTITPDKRVYIIKAQNGYMYRFFAILDPESDEYNTYEKVIANTVLNEPKNK